MQSERGETGQTLQRTSSSSATNTFSFKFQDKKGRMHRFICDVPKMSELVTAIVQRIGAENIDRNNLPQILYEDDDNDKVVLASDSDLQAAVYHARLAGLKGIRLHLDYIKVNPHRRRPVESNSRSKRYAEPETSSSMYTVVATGATLFAALGVYAMLRRAQN